MAGAIALDCSANPPRMHPFSPLTPVERPEVSLKDSPKPGELRQSACLTKDVTPAKAMSMLKGLKTAGRSVYWKHLIPRVNPASGYACLFCIDCESYLSASNPSRTAQDHFGKQCNRDPVCHLAAKASAKMSNDLKRSAEVAGLEGRGCFLNVTGGSSSSSSGSCSSLSSSSSSISSSSSVGPVEDADSITNYIPKLPPPQVKNRAVELIVRSILSNNIPMSIVEDKDLRAGVALLGVSLPTRKIVAGPMLDAEYEKVKQQTIAERNSWVYYAVSTDG